jgi:hypothetical protein
MDRATAIIHIKEMHGGCYTYKDVASFKVALATLLVPPLRMTRSESALGSGLRVINTFDSSSTGELENGSADRLDPDPRRLNPFALSGSK